MKKTIVIFVFVLTFLFSASPVEAGWVSGYFKSNGTYVNGYYRSDPDVYKWNNYSFDDDWTDAYNDNTYYRNYGYDPEPYDNDYVSTYSSNYYWNNTYDNYDYDYDYYDSYNDYDYYDYDYDYDSSWGSSYSWDW